MQRFRLAQRFLGATVAAVAVVVAAGVGAHAALTDPSPDSSAQTDPTPSPGDPGQSADNHAIAVNHGDDHYRYALSLKVVQVTGSVVDPQNAAVAVGSDCTGCETVAISLEGVLVYGDPTVFAPENVALAYNDNCTNCMTAAMAYQDIVQTSDRVRITGEGRQEIAAIRRDLESIRHSDLSLADIDAKVNADAGQLLAVLQNDVMPVGKPGAGDTSATPSPAMSATGGASQSPGSQDSSSSSPSPTPSDTGSGSPSTSPTPTDGSSGSASPSPSG